MSTATTSISSVSLPTTTTTISRTTSPSSPSSFSSPLDPNQIRALQSLNIPTSKDPCSPLHNSATTCDSCTPFRHLLSLKLSDCSNDVALSSTALKSLSTLKDLQFINCPISPIPFPTELTSNLLSFTCINSFKNLTAVTFNSIKNLRSVTISSSNLTGYLPKHWNSNITNINLSGNQLKGKIPTSLTRLEILVSLDLSSNSLDGEIPETIGDLASLQNLSFSSNSLSGSIPDTLTAIPNLLHLDLGSNQLNGTVPEFLSKMQSLKYLNLENNHFHGVLPFNASFFKTLVVFKVGENSNLCYNRSTLSSKLKLGIAPCDKHGLPMSPAPAKDDVSTGDLTSEVKASDSPKASNDPNIPKFHKGPHRVVLGVAIGLASIVFVIFSLVCLLKCCKCC